MLPVYGPHDEDMTVGEWFELTLKRIAHGEEETDEFSNFIAVVRKLFKVFDVGSLMQLTRLQLEQAAIAAVGEQGKKGLVRMVCKYLGSEGCAHAPPLELTSDALQNPNEVENENILFGRAGKTGANSTESNFPRAMIPSRRTRVLYADELQFPPRLQQWIAEKCRPYNKEHKMPRDVATTITHTVGDWIVAMYGLSPVSTSAGSSHCTSFM